jgi:hypothetical protein
MFVFLSKFLPIFAYPVGAAAVLLSCIFWYINGEAGKMGS